MKNKFTTGFRRIRPSLSPWLPALAALFLLTPSSVMAQDQDGARDKKDDKREETAGPAAEVVERLLKQARDNGGRLQLTPRQLQELGGMDRLMQELKRGVAKDGKDPAESGATPAPAEESKEKENLEEAEKKTEQPETKDESGKEKAEGKETEKGGLEKFLDLMGNLAQKRSVAETEKLDPFVMAAYKPVVRNAARSTVRMLKDGDQVALGTIVDADGYVLSKASELGDGPLRAQLYGGITIPARILDTDKKHDLALVQLGATGLRPIEWADEPVVGSLLACPSAGDNPIGIGAVSVASRNLSEADKGFLGVRLDEDEKGAKVTAVVEDSPAEKAGIQVNDVVYAIEGQEVKKVLELIDIVSRRKPEETIVLGLHRGEEKKELEVTLGSRAMLGTPVMPGRNEMMNRVGNNMNENRTGYPCALQHDLVIQPNEAGGPVVGLDGRAIGINIARSGRVMSYAIPAAHLKELLGNVKNGKLGPKVDYSAIVEELKRLEGLVDKISGSSKDAEAARAKLGEALKDLKKLSETN